MRILNQRCTVFLQCDIQEKFLKTIFRINSVIHTAKILNKTADIFKIPLIVSEQIPKNLGRTLPEITATYPKSSTFIYEKTSMSMWPQLCDYIKEDDYRNQFVLYGIECHVCILQTAIDLRRSGHDVYVITDGVSSSRPLDRSTGIRRLEGEGCKLNTYEGIIMELLKDADSEYFKSCLNLLKEKRPDDMLDSL